MAVKWDGFTDDDLRKLGVNECLIEGQQQRKLPSEVRVAKRQASQLKGSGKKNVARERMLHKAPMTSTDSAVNEIPESARLCKPKKVPDTKSAAEKLPLMSEGSSDSGCGVSNGVPSSPSESSKVSSTDASPSRGQVFLRIKEGKNYEVVGTDKVSLDDFQTRHKIMEEQNRRRKELLAKALADRKKQTHEEARRLQQIQDELQKLDVLLSNDVGILRNQIEVASYEFMEAQKRYDKAEKEFLEAKLCMFGKLERKELLTEHLCTIIEQNEMRKARKLSELMDKLELGTSIELSEEEQKHAAGSAMLSPLCALDEVSYSACNTLKSRRKDSETTAENTLEQTKQPPVQVNTPSLEEKSAPNTSCMEQKSAPNTSGTEQKSAPNISCMEQKSAPNTSGTEQKSAPNISCMEQKSAPNTSGMEQKSVPNISGTEQKSAPNTPGMEQKSVPNTPSMEQKSVPNTPGMEQKSVAYTPGMGQKSVPNTPGMEQKSVPSTSIMEQKSVPNTPGMEQKSVLEEAVAQPSELQQAMPATRDERTDNN